MPSLDHKIEVEALSAVEGKARRELARAEFVSAAEAAGPGSKEAQVLELETRQRGGETRQRGGATDEPDSLKCRGLASAILRAASAAT